MTKYIIIFTLALTSFANSNTENCQLRPIPETNATQGSCYDTEGGEDLLFEQTGWLSISLEPDVNPLEDRK